MTLDQQIRDFNKKLKAKDLILSEWYDYDSKVFTFSIWTRQTDEYLKNLNNRGNCLYTSSDTSRRKAFNELVADFNKDQS